MIRTATPADVEAYWQEWAATHAGAIVDLRRLCFALGERIAICAETLAHRAERRPVVITETDSCPLG